MKNLKKCLILFTLVGVGAFYLSANAWTSCEPTPTWEQCLECNPDVLTHCEPIDTPLCQVWDACNTTDTQHEEPNPNDPEPNDDVQNQSPQEPAYLYIKYRDTSGRDIYNVPTYKGVDGEVVDLSQYQKDISMFKFLKYKPAGDTITLNAKKSQSVILLYEKVTKPVPSESNENTPTVTKKTQPKSSSLVAQKQKKVKMFRGMLDSAFAQPKMQQGNKKEKLLHQLKVMINYFLKKPLPDEKKVIMESLLEAVESYEK